MGHGQQYLGNMDKIEIKKELMGKVIKKSYPELVKGGQHVDVPRGISLYCEEFDIEIRIHAHRSQHKNLELAMTLMELAWDDLIK